MLIENNYQLPWIPYDEFQHIIEIGNGRFVTVYHTNTPQPSPILLPACIPSPAPQPINAMTATIQNVYHECGCIITNKWYRRRNVEVSCHLQVAGLGFKS
ncbi:hypothetical protein F8M41_005245 [Gigaspora margarita]|uniref:Protein kinase domain-containing protein n=1 Tax=Gigaspora margarita TaxID=4874 RepID=A0A8H4A6Z4_GIGMA|nr:hypothetical protein F8M41_005245 [Gigaspora margarita]